MSRLTIVLFLAAGLAGCASAPASRKVDDVKCTVTDQALADVQYKIDPSRPYDVDVQCARCDDVYVAAHHEWLRKSFPGRMWVEHFEGVSTEVPHRHEKDASCFRIPVSEAKVRTICFTNSGLCNRDAS